MRRRLAIALSLSATSVSACALIASLPDYEELPGDAGTSDRADDTTGGEGGVDGGSGDAKPDVEALGCGPPIGAGLVAHYRFDEGLGTTVSDCTGASPGAFGGAAPAWVKGRVGPFALAFDGGGFVDIERNASLAITGALSVAAWVNVASFSSPGRIIAKGGGPTDRGWNLNVENDGLALFQLGLEPSGQTQVATARALPTGRWLHLAGTFEPGKALRIYVDGQEAGAVTTGVPTSMRNSPSPANLGRRGDGCCGLIGQIDDVRVYTRVLTPAEIADLAAQ
ncbi:MAG: LamG domain-containing protein [Deltaproteobacteria bacterium]|nr:LamG domain-containing protein [Deltaproteobacteria bacterium]